ncbi:MAG: hypothetical protein HY722_05115 [Planctomycetes bacterium]|nr:hypothetical protein [Planctomycetota bacterium]
MTAAAPPDDLSRLVWPMLFGAAGARDAGVALASRMRPGGVLLMGGEASDLPDWVAGLHEAARAPLLVAADLERGAGQQFAGATSLPPPMAVGAARGPAEDLELARLHGEVTAREARNLGVTVVFAPVADVQCEPANPIVGTRSFGEDPARVAARVAAWVVGAQAEGVLACAKHFPGHGATRADSHVELPRVDEAARTLRERELVPFRRAVLSGVGAVMTAHVAYPALDPTGRAATFSRPIIDGLLRRELGFRGLVVTDALLMGGASTPGGEVDSAVRALAAGCDVLLAPADPEGLLAGLRERLAAGEVPAARVREAAARVGEAWQVGGIAPRRPDPADSAGAARRMAEAGLVLVREGPAWPPLAAGRRAALIALADDAEEDAAPLGADLVLTPASGPAEHEAARRAAREAGFALVGVVCTVRAWKGRAGLAEPLAGWLAALEVPATVVAFGSPYVIDQVHERAGFLAAWGIDGPSVEAALAACRGELAPRGRLPVALASGRYPVGHGLG